MGLQEVDLIAREAVACNDCFDRLKRPEVGFAQPRFIGSKYWDSNPRVMVIALNPGAGKSRVDGGNTRFNTILARYAIGDANLDDVFGFQREDMPYWGRLKAGQPPGQYVKFYSAGLGLKLDQLAFANMAWCASVGDNYPRWMLEHCYEKHTKRLLVAINPQVVLLSGSNTHPFESVIAEAIPDAEIVTMLHYAHRGGNQVERDELNRVKKIIENIGQ